MNTLIETLTVDAQMKLNQYCDRARKEEDGKLPFSSFMDIDGQRVSYDCTVCVPLTPQYQSDVDDYYFVEPEDVLIEDMKVDCIEPLCATI